MSSPSLPIESSSLPDFKFRPLKPLALFGRKDHPALQKLNKCRTFDQVQDLVSQDPDFAREVHIGSPNAIWPRNLLRRRLWAPVFEFTQLAYESKNFTALTCDEKELERDGLRALITLKIDDAYDNSAESVGKEFQAPVLVVAFFFVDTWADGLRPFRFLPLNVVKHIVWLMQGINSWIPIKDQTFRVRMNSLAPADERDMQKYFAFDHEVARCRALHAAGAAADDCKAAVDKLLDHMESQGYLHSAARRALANDIEAIREKNLRQGRLHLPNYGYVLAVRVRCRDEFLDVLCSFPTGRDGLGQRAVLFTCTQAQFDSCPENAAVLERIFQWIKKPENGLGVYADDVRANFLQRCEKYPELRLTPETATRATSLAIAPSAAAEMDASPSPSPRPAARSAKRANNKKKQQKKKAAAVARRKASPKSSDSEEMEVESGRSANVARPLSRLRLEDARATPEPRCRRRAPADYISAPESDEDMQGDDESVPTGAQGLAPEGADPEPEVIMLECDDPSYDSQVGDSSDEDKRWYRLQPPSSAPDPPAAAAASSDARPACSFAPWASTRSEAEDCARPDSEDDEEAEQKGARSRRAAKPPCAELQAPFVMRAKFYCTVSQTWIVVHAVMHYVTPSDRWAGKPEFEALGSKVAVNRNTDANMVSELTLLQRQKHVEKYTREQKDQMMSADFDERVARVNAARKGLPPPAPPRVVQHRAPEGCLITQTVSGSGAGAGGGGGRSKGASGGDAGGGRAEKKQEYVFQGSYPELWAQHTRDGNHRRSETFVLEDESLDARPVRKLYLHTIVQVRPAWVAWTGLVGRTFSSLCASAQACGHERDPRLFWKLLYRGVRYPVALLCPDWQDPRRPGKYEPAKPALLVRNPAQLETQPPLLLEYLKLRCDSECQEITCGIKREEHRGYVKPENREDVACKQHGRVLWRGGVQETLEHLYMIPFRHSEGQLTAAGVVARSPQHHAELCRVYACLDQTDRARLPALPPHWHRAQHDCRALAKHCLALADREQAGALWTAVAQLAGRALDAHRQFYHSVVPVIEGWDGLGSLDALELPPYTCVRVVFQNIKDAYKRTGLPRAGELWVPFEVYRGAEADAFAIQRQKCDLDRQYQDKFELYKESYRIELAFRRYWLVVDMFTNDRFADVDGKTVSIYSPERYFHRLHVNNFYCATYFPLCSAEERERKFTFTPYQLRRQRADNARDPLEYDFDREHAPRVRFKRKADKFEGELNWDDVSASVRHLYRPCRNFERDSGEEPSDEETAQPDSESDEEHEALQPYLQDDSCEDPAHVRESLRLEKVAALERLLVSRRTLKSAPPHVRRSKRVVRAAVRMSPWALEYASEKLRGDRKTVMMAVRRCPHGIALRYASDELRRDAEVVRAAVRAHPWAIYHSSKSMLLDANMLLLVERGVAKLNLKHASVWHFPLDPTRDPPDEKSIKARQQEKRKERAERQQQKRLQAMC